MRSSSPTAGPARDPSSPGCTRSDDRPGRCRSTTRHALSGLLGTDIDAELEPYRRAGEGSVVTWLHQVG
ncbi:DUF3145 family protein [Nakamurella flavida]|nr:DUF3145 family protein [Nakamurella flavida]